MPTRGTKITPTRSYRSSARCTSFRSCPPSHGVRCSTPEQTTSQRSFSVFTSPASSAKSVPFHAALFKVSEGSIPLSTLYQLSDLPSYFPQYRPVIVQLVSPTLHSCCTRHLNPNPFYSSACKIVFFNLLPDRSHRAFRARALSSNS